MSKDCKTTSRLTHNRGKVFEKKIRSSRCWRRNGRSTSYNRWSAHPRTPPTEPADLMMLIGCLASRRVFCLTFILPSLSFDPFGGSAAGDAKQILEQSGVLGRIRLCIGGRRWAKFDRRPFCVANDATQVHGFAARSQSRWFSAAAKRTLRATGHYG